MPNNIGTLVIAAIRPAGTLDTFPSAYANELLGGHYSVATTTDRDNIPSERRLEGMFCYVSADQNIYELVGGIDNTNWMVFSGGGSINHDASQLTTGTLPDARLSSNVTKQGNTFNGVSQLVQLDSSGKLPAIDGSQLINLPVNINNDAAQLTIGTLPDGRLSANVTLQGNTFNIANKLVQLDSVGRLPALNASQLTNVPPTTNASLLTIGSLADARLSANVTLQGNTFNGINQLIQLDSSGKLPVLDASALINLDSTHLTGIIPLARLSIFIGSGIGHAAGIVPDPGSTAGTDRYLREDSTWAVPPTSSGGGGGGVTSIDLHGDNVIYNTGTGGPITGAGTLTLSLKSQVAHRFLGTDTITATPTFKALTFLDLPSFDLVTLLGTTLIRGVSKEVWIAVRTDNKTGQGTFEDPFDASGSTQLQAAAKLEIILGNQPINTRINFAPGDYYMFLHDTVYWSVRSGWQIHGAGMNLTTIHAVPDHAANNPSGFYSTSPGTYDLSQIHFACGMFCTFHTYNSTTHDNIQITDLTVDANFAGLANSLGDGIGSARIVTDGVITSDNPNMLQSATAIFQFNDLYKGVIGAGIPSISINLAAGSINQLIMPNTLDFVSSPQSSHYFTIHLASDPIAAGLPKCGAVWVNTTSNGLQYVSYNDISGNDLIQCITVGNGLMTGSVVWPSTKIIKIAETQADRSSIGSTIPVGNWNLNVLSTADFPTTGTFTIATSLGFYNISYGNKTSTSFQNCTGGQGVILGGTEGRIFSENHVILSTNCTPGTALNVNIGGEKRIAIGCIGVGGSNCLIERVRVIGVYGSAWNSLGTGHGTPYEGQAYECLPFGITGPQNKSITNCHIRHSLEDSCYGSYTDGIGLSGCVATGGSGANNLITNSSISHCNVIGINDGRNDSGISQHAYGFSWAKNCQFIHNVATDTGDLFYTDTGTLEDILIANNESVRAQNGILVVANDIKKNIDIINNRIGLQSRKASPHAFQTQYAATGLRIKNNTIVIAPREYQTSFYEYYVDTPTLKNSFLDDNLILAENAIQIQPNGAGMTSDVMMFGEQFLTGSVLKVAGTTTTPGGYFQFKLNGSFTIAAGDHLQYEVYSDPNNPLHSPVCQLSSSIGVNDAFDQNGLNPYAPLDGKAVGRWYYRDIDLTKYAAQNVSFIVVGIFGIASLYGNMPAGDYKFYYRNIKVVKADGTIKLNYYTAESKVTPVLNATSNSTNYTAYDFIGKDIFGTPVNRGIDAEIYLAIRMDGQAGSGTAEDPFDCSNTSTPGTSPTKFDTILRGYYAAATNNITFHLGVGTFYHNMLFYAVNQDKMWFVRPGWKFVGAGKYLTTVAAVGDMTLWFSTGAGRKIAVFRTGTFTLSGTATISGLLAGNSWIGSGDSDSCVISDLTIDCGFQNLFNTIADGGVYRTFTTTSNMPNAYTLISTNGNFIKTDIGKTVTGTNIPANTFIGNVVDANTIQLSTTPASNTLVNLSPLVTNGATISIKSKDMCCQGIGLDGSHNRVERVRVINSHGNSKEQNECFIVRLDGNATVGGTDNWVIDTNIENCLGDYDTMAVMFGTDIGSGRLTHSGFKRCYLNGINWAGLDSNIGFGISNSSHCEITDCVVDGGNYGFYFDTGNSTDTRITNNTFSNVQFGVNIPALFSTSAAGSSDFLISNNSITCRLAGIVIGTNTADDQLSNITVIGNDINIAPDHDVSGTGWGVGIVVGDYTDHWYIADNNIIADTTFYSTPDAFQISNGSEHIIIHNNHANVYGGINFSVSGPNAGALTKLEVTNNVLECSWAGIYIPPSFINGAIIKNNWIFGQAQGYGIDFNSTTGHTIIGNTIDKPSPFNNFGTGYNARLNYKSDGTIIGTPKPFAVLEGGTGTSNPSLVQGSNINITGSWPNQTISVTGLGGNLVYDLLNVADNSIALEYNSNGIGWKISNPNNFLSTLIPGFDATNTLNRIKTNEIVHLGVNEHWRAFNKITFQKGAQINFGRNSRLALV